MKILNYFFFLLLLFACQQEAAPTYVTLSVRVNPAGAGSIEPQSGEWEEGSSVTLSALANPNYVFESWTGDWNGAASPFVLVMDSDKMITGNFRLLDDDNDGVVNSLDQCNNTPLGEIVNAEGCSSTQITITDSISPDNAPSDNFDLSTWKLTIPESESGVRDDDAIDISVAELINQYTHPAYFYTAEDGGMVFRCSPRGARTSSGTKYARTELREMLRGTDTSIPTQGVNQNNWVFGSAPQADIDAAGGYDGHMEATLAINEVTTTGDSGQVGRVVIGQIHANSDEPIRVYYRKLPNNEKGTVYFAHEPRTGSEIYIDDMIGSRSSSASNPTDGIALNERFTYVIDVVGNMLTFTLSRAGKADIIRQVDMSNSRFDESGQYMYFKAGVYVQNNTGNEDDFTQATFYSIEKSHTN